jgi:cytochrome c-type biogenesis protein CcmE
MQRGAFACCLLLGACTREQARSASGDAVVAVAQVLLEDRADSGVLEMIELDAIGPAHHGRRVKVHGYVLRDTIERRPGTDAWRFGMARRGARLVVEYEGVLPQDFAEQREVIATGVLGEDGTHMVAAEVLSRCPEDYEELKRAAP